MENLLGSAASAYIRTHTHAHCQLQLKQDGEEGKETNFLQEPGCTRIVDVQQHAKVLYKELDWHFFKYRKTGRVAKGGLESTHTGSRAPGWDGPEKRTKAAQIETRRIKSVSRK